MDYSSVMQRMSRVFNRGCNCLKAFKSKSEEDACLISFPKAGRTWLRTMMGKAISLQYGVGNLSEIVELTPLTRSIREFPTVGVNHVGKPHTKEPSELQLVTEPFENKKVVVLIRDIRDTAVSMFYHHKCRAPGVFIDPSNVASVDSFCRSSVGSVKTIVAFYNHWIDFGQRHRDFMLVRYEDLRCDPVEELTQIFDFLAPHCISERSIHQAVDFGAFENLKAIEASNASENSRLSSSPNSDVNARKVRRGVVGGYRDELAPATIAWINAYVERHFRGETEMLLSAALPANTMATGKAA